MSSGRRTQPLTACAPDAFAGRIVANVAPTRFVTQEIAVTRCQGTPLLRQIEKGCTMAMRSRDGISANGAFPRDTVGRQQVESSTSICGLRGRWTQPRLRDLGAPESGPSDEGKTTGWTTSRQL